MRALALIDSNHCILGQVYGPFLDYRELLRVAHVASGAGSSLGFDLEFRQWWHMRRSFRMLQDAWIVAIADRLYPVREPQDLSVTADAVSGQTDTLASPVRV